MKKSIIFIAMLATIAGSISASAGLLGKRSIGINIGNVRPGDDAVREFDNSILTYGANIRLPIDSHLDFIANIGQAKISGDLPIYDPYYLRTYMVKVDGTSTSLGGGLTYQFKPNEKVNPYLGLGIMWSKVKFESMGESEDEDDTGIIAGGGIELNVNDQASFDIGLSYQSEMYDEDEITVGLGFNVWVTPEFRLSIAVDYGTDLQDMGISGGIGIGF